MKLPSRKLPAFGKVLIYDGESIQQVAREDKRAGAHFHIVGLLTRVSENCGELDKKRGSPPAVKGEPLVNLAMVTSSFMTMMVLGPAEVPGL